MQDIDQLKRERNVYRTLSFELYVALAAVLEMPNEDGQDAVITRLNAKRNARALLHRIRDNHLKPTHDNQGE